MEPDVHCEPVAAQQEDVYDVVIVGSGVAGLSSALFAARAGLHPVVLEKAALLGGASCWSYGAIWMGCNDLAAAAGIDDRAEDVAAYLDFLGGGENSPSRTQALIEGGNRAVRALRDAGIALQLMEGVNDILYGKAPGAALEGRTLEAPPFAGHLLGSQRPRLRTPRGEEWRVPKAVVARARSPGEAHRALSEASACDQLAQGAGLVAHLVAALDRLGVPLLTEVTVESLLLAAGRITGIRSAGGRTWGARRATLLACGNYLSNSALVSRFDSLPEYRSWYPLTHTGDGLALAGKAGASIGVTRNNLMVMLGYGRAREAEDADAGVPSVRDLPRAHTLVVNRAGLRFGNEALFQELAPALRMFDLSGRKPKNLPCWMIFDQRYLLQWGFAGQGAEKLPSWVIEAPDIAQLAQLTGIDGKALTSTIARFNGFAATGVDEDFDRKPGWTLTPGSGSGCNASLGAIDTPPFFAARLYPTLGGAGAGLRADARARVLDWQDRPIEALYAVGDVAQHDEFGAGYQAGITFASALTFALLATEDIVKR